MITIKDGEIITGSGELLPKAIAKFKEKPIRVLKDQYGTYAIVTKGYVVVAKAYIYGNIVSCHSEAVRQAFVTERKLVMYIDKADKFYVFEPVEVEKSSTINKRGKAIMMNFDIRNGVDIDKTLKPKPKGKQTTLK